MEISIFGSGYVGLVTAVCFAQMGNSVTCVDIDEVRVKRLQQGINPLYEPGLSDLLKQNLAEGRLHFSSDAKTAISHTEIIFIGVGTPPKSDGSADLQYVLNVAKTIGQHLSSYAVIVNKSTVPVGTADLVKETIAIELKRRNASVEYDVISNPEFLKEGSAVSDCMKPDRVIIGSNSPRAIELMKVLYAPFNRNHDKIQVMDTRSAELTKYAANAMLATKISFMNELSQLAEKVGVDIEQVRRGIGSDPRIGYSFIYPGCGYGGSCFPKDVQALAHIAKINDYQPQLLQAVHEVNERQKSVLFNKIHAHFKGQLAGKVIALWGLAFKPNTDDIREAPSLILIEKLLAAGALVQAYDPKAMEHVKTLFINQERLSYGESAMAVLTGADSLMIVTEWLEFRSPDFAEIKKQLRTPVIVDGRNLYDVAYLKQQGFNYYSIGRV